MNAPNPHDAARAQTPGVRTSPERKRTLIRVFDGISVIGDGGPVELKGLRQRRLLALLVIRTGSIADVDWLAEYLWDDDERPVATTPAVRTAVYRLRAAFPEEARDWLETTPDGYRLVAPEDAVEHRRFAALRARATAARQANDHLAALSLLDEALGLWRGEPFRELEDLEWAYAEIERLRMDRLEAMEERWEAALALGRHTQITGELAAFTVEHADRDRATRQYALALHRAGRTAEALKLIAAHKRLLVEEYGLDPSVAMRELEQALLRGDASLEIEADVRPLRGYLLLDEIGVGAFSVVWRARQPSIDREVAVKQIRSELANQPDFIRRFAAEAHLVARIEHPHVVPLIDFWRDPDSAYLVMRLMCGGTLEQRLEDGPLSLEEALRLADQIGGGLSAAHGLGVIHRDVKPGNIFFDERGNAYLGDFGIAASVAATTKTEMGGSLGTPAYAAPEQLKGGPVGPEADIFSLATVLRECLGEAAPDAISAALDTATLQDPAQRHPSIEAFVDALATERPAPISDAIPSPTATSLGPISNPYLGLRAFDDADADRFFGRERLVADLVAHLAAPETARCLIVVGPSGSGKSSVVRAGLIPALRSDAIEGSADWYVSSLVPGSDPYEALEAALLRIAVNPPPSLIEQLRADDRGILRGIRRCLPSDDATFALVVDQFEEIFTGRDGAAYDGFLVALAVAVTDPSSPLRLVGTLRADYYDKPLEHPTFAPVLGPATVNVTPLAGDELEMAIVEPARRVGVVYEPGVAARIAAELTGQASPLPLLQFALAELFDRRAGAEIGAQDLDALGGLSGTIAARAESIYRAADDDERAAIRRIMGGLADPTAASGDVRRRVPVANLGDDAATALALQHLGEARLITFDRDEATREPTVEVAHEALLRVWPRLIDWLAEDRELRRETEALQDAADRWDDGGRTSEDLARGVRLQRAVALAESDTERLRPLDLEFVDVSSAAFQAEAEAERRRSRRQRLLMGGVGIAVALALVAGGLAVLQQSRADAEAKAAAADRARLTTLVQRAADDPTSQAGLLLALEARRQAPGPETDAVLLGALQPLRAQETAEYSTSAESSGCASALQSVLTPRRTNPPASREVSIESSDAGVRPAVSCDGLVGDPTSGRRYSILGDSAGKRLWLGPVNGPWEVDVRLAEESWISGPAGFAGERLLLEQPGWVRLVDSVTGRTIGAPITGLAEDPLVLLSADGQRFAVVSEATAGGNLVSIRDAIDGAELQRVELPGEANVLYFDVPTDELLVGTTEGELTVVGLDS
jgi:serine/threonine protein kinase